MARMRFTRAGIKRKFTAMAILQLAALDRIHKTPYCVSVRNKHITLTEPVASIIDSEIANGRYKDVSAALNDAAWHHFIGVPSPFAEYGVTAEEVERSARRDLERIKADRRAGKLIAL
jgi:hypothetical protein